MSRRITSQRINDCGVCAVANALDLSWRDAAARIWGPQYTNRLKFNTKTRQITAALGNPEMELMRARFWFEIPDRSVVKVIPPECEGTGNWHWVVWRSGKIWDSVERRTMWPWEYGCRLVSYLGVHP